MTFLRTALCQLHPITGAIKQNTIRLCATLDELEATGCDLAVFGELSITGYPPEDLVFKKQFIADNLAAMQKIAEHTKACAAVVGFIDRNEETGAIYNAAALCYNGKIQGIYHKQKLPNYTVFDEKRYFTPGADATPLNLNGLAIGLSICEDIWHIEDGPCAEMARQGADVLVNVSASPFHRSKEVQRSDILVRQAKHTQLPIVYTNIVGGQDELVFDGGSLVLDATGNVVAQAEQFQEQILQVSVQVPAGSFVSRYKGAEANTLADDIARDDPQRDIWEALKLGLKSYVHDNGFSTVCLGLSGGIDSALTAVIAADALGAENVHAVLMPSRYSSDHSIGDAKTLCENIGISHTVVEIEAMHKSYENQLLKAFGTEVKGITDENLQSRIRGVTLMAFANQNGWLVITTGNKTELAVGYSTLYGDTAGAFAAIKDVWKTQVYTLAQWRNTMASGSCIPENSITKPASAELRPDQRDDQSLPPYDVLDAVLIDYVENNQTATEIIAATAADEESADMIHTVTRLVDRAEFKRRQSPLGTRVSARAFGRDRRMPVTNRY